MTIQEAIRVKRALIGITRIELSQRTGIPYSNLKLWEKGGGAPTLVDCIRIARGLGITIGELIADVSLPEDEAVEER